MWSSAIIDIRIPPLAAKFCPSGTTIVAQTSVLLPGISRLFDVLLLGERTLIAGTQTSLEFSSSELYSSMSKLIPFGGLCL